MRHLIFYTLVFLFTIIDGNAQTKMPKNINDDFAYAIIDNYNGYGNIRVYINESLRSKGYKSMDIDILVESITNNTKNRNIILQVFSDICGKNEEYLYRNLYSLGIPASSSKYLAEYIAKEKYKPTKVVNSEYSKKTLQQTTKYTYPDYLINLNDYSPEVSTVCQEQGYSDCLRDVSKIVKELSNIRNTHLKNKNNENYLTFYKTKKAATGKRTWANDALAIDKYIAENIKIYEEAIKESGYDWAKKLPQDLYKLNNLNKTEILKNKSISNNLKQ